MSLKYILVIWFGAMWGFLAVMNAKRIFTEHQGNTFWEIHTLPLALIAVVLDVLFNLLFGTVMFLELPKYFAKEWLFSWRVQRHVEAYMHGKVVDGKSATWRQKLALFWGKQLNIVDPRHIEYVGPPW